MTITEDADRVVLHGRIFRLHGRAVSFTEAPPPPPREQARRPAHVAEQLALAHHLRRALDAGKLGDQATLARALGLSRARVTHLLDLTLLAPDLQDEVLALEAIDGAEPMAERALWAVVRAGSWREQRDCWQHLRGSDPACTKNHIADFRNVDA